MRKLQFKKDLFIINRKCISYIYFQAGELLRTKSHFSCTVCFERCHQTELSRVPAFKSKKMVVSFVLLMKDGIRTVQHLSEHLSK